MPVTLSAISAGAGLIQGVAGLFSGNKARKQIENTPTPYYQPDKGLMDYYQDALGRYNTNPYSSQMYQVAQNSANSRLATGIGALQDRRSAVGNIGALVGGSNASLQQAGVQAEAQRNRDFATLGQATNMEAGDKRLQFQYNQLLPYQKRMSVFEAKAEGGNAMENAGLSNLFNGIGGVAAAGGFRRSPSSSMRSYATYNPALAPTAGSYNSPASNIPTIGPSPAGNIGYINPNSYYTS